MSERERIQLKKFKHILLLEQNNIRTDTLSSNDFSLRKRYINTQANFCDFITKKKDNNVKQLIYSKRNALNEYSIVQHKVPFGKNNFIQRNGVHIFGYDPGKQFCKCDNFFHNRRQVTQYILE
jgi:hypothetical protein